MLWTSPIDGQKYVTVERRIWRWQLREYAADGWVTLWGYRPWHWLRPLARKHFSLAEMQREKTQFSRALLNRLANPSSPAI